MYAIVETGGKQYRVEPGTIFQVEKLEGNKGDSLILGNVLMVTSEGKTSVGAPYVKGAKVNATIVAQEKGEKLSVFRYKPKKRVRVKTGHRQNYTRLRVTDIIAG